MRWLIPELSIWILQAGSVGSVLPAIVSRLQGAYEATTPKGEWTLIPASLPPHAKVLLYGYDHAFPKGKARANPISWVPKGVGEWAPLPEPSPPLHLATETLKTKDILGEALLTDTTQLVYKRTLLTWWYLGWHRRDLPPQYIYTIQRGLKGALREFPAHEGWESADEAPFYTREDVERAYVAYQEGAGIVAGESAGRDGVPLSPGENNLEVWREGLTLPSKEVKE